jgi:hypothetical protein
MLLSARIQETKTLTLDSGLAPLFEPLSLLTGTSTTESESAIQHGYYFKLKCEFSISIRVLVLLGFLVYCSIKIQTSHYYIMLIIETFGFLMLKTRVYYL